MSADFLVLLNETVAGIAYKDWRLVVGIDNQRFYLQWTFRAPDWATDDCKTLQTWSSRKWHLSPHMVKQEIVQTAFMAAVAAEEHEARKAFFYSGARPFHPHISLSALMEASQHIVCRPNPT